jgi:hypothetical protein
MTPFALEVEFGTKRVTLLPHWLVKVVQTMIKLILLRPTFFQDFN